MATKKLTFNNVEYDIDMDKLSDAIAALTARIDEVKKVIIILEQKSSDTYALDYLYYNGEIADGNFVYDCLTSGGTVMIDPRKYNGLLYEVTSWEVADGKLILSTGDASVGGRLTISI